MGFIGSIVTGIFGTGVIGQTIAAVATSYATSAVTNALFGQKQGSNSPTYSIGALQTQTNSNMVMPIIYGRVKCAGNNIWQNGSGSTVNRLVGFGLGKNKGVYDIRLDDKQIEGLSGCSYTAYMGDGIQLIDNRVDKDTVTTYVYTNIVPSSVQAGETWYSDGYTWTAFYDTTTKTVRGRRETGTTTSTLDTQEKKARVVGGMKYDAYLALTIAASDQISSNPNVTAVWDGRIVKIYSKTAKDGYTLDLKTGYFFKEEWSDNVWCILDFMTGWYGCNIPIADIDIEQFITMAEYAQPSDEKRRWSINLIMDEKKSRQDWLNEMLLCFRAWRTYQNGKHGILIDKPEPVSQIFKVKKTESIRHDWQEISKDYERIIVKYRDPDYEWQQVGAPATIKPPFRNAVYDDNGALLSNGTPLTKTIEINGITNFKQASQMAWFILNQAQTCQDVITYECNKRALNRTIGDVAGIEDPILQIHEDGFSCKRYRVIAMTEPQGMKITLVMTEYNEALYTDEMGSVAPVVNVSKLPNPVDTPTDVTNLVAEEHSRDQGNGTVINDLYLTFDPPDYLYYSHSEVYIKSDNPSADEIGIVPDELADMPYDELASALNVWKFVGNALDKITIQNLVKGQEYSIKVVSVTKTYNVKANFNNAPVIKHTIQGKTYQPYPPTGLTVTITDIATVKWDKASQTDVDYTEVRIDRNPGAEDGKLAKTAANKANVTLPSRSGTVYLYHHNTGGNYSDPAWYEYNKPKPSVPKNVKITPIIQGFVVSCDALPSYFSGINVHVDNGTSTEICFSPNNTYTFKSTGGIYDVQVAYVDLFGEGTLSEPQEVTVVAYIDPALLKAESISLEKMDAIMKDAVFKAQNAVSGTTFNASINQLNQADSNNAASITQVAGQITSVVTELGKPIEQCSYTAIAQANSAIQLRATKDNLISLINVCPETISIKSSLLHIAADTLIDGNIISTGMLKNGAVNTEKLAAGSVTADKMTINSLSAITGTIGTLRTATTGARTEISDNLIQVFDSSNVLRVRLGVWT